MWNFNDQSCDCGRCVSCLAGMMKLLPGEDFSEKDEEWRDQVFTDTSHDGQKFSWRVGDIYDYVDGRGYPIQIPVELLEEDNLQMSPEDVADEVIGSPEFIARAQESDLSYPIIVVRYPPSRRDPDGALFIADGVHRLWKAIDEGHEFIDGFLIEQDDLWDIDHEISRDDIVESVSSSLLTEGANTRLGALVIGDSQAQGRLGALMAASLTENGYIVTRLAYAGASTAKVHDQLVASYSGQRLVVVFSGGNDAYSDRTGSVGTISFLDRIRSFCYKNRAYLIFVGPPPATVIEPWPSNKPDPKIPSFPAAKSPDYHLKREGGKFAAGRRMISDAIQEKDEEYKEKGCRTWGIATKVSDYPDQPDGIHCVVGAERIVSQILIDVNIAGITAMLLQDESRRK
jgi:hypothetical protein